MSPIPYVMAKENILTFNKGSRNILNREDDVSRTQANKKYRKSNIQKLRSDIVTMKKSGKVSCYVYQENLDSTDLDFR